MMSEPRFAPLAAVLLTALLLSSTALAGHRSGGNRAPVAIEDMSAAETGPVDWGFGPGVRPGGVGQKLRQLASAARSASAAVGGPDAHLAGAWGAPITWPIVGLHAVLVPDGRVMTFGSDIRGKDTGKLYYDIWDPALGTGADSHWLLDNTTATDIFCAAQTVLATTGEVAIFGGDAKVGTKRHHSNNKLTLFRPESNTVVNLAPMFVKRWYPSTVAMPDGRVLILGGRQEVSGTPAPTPEILSTGGTWTLLSGATSQPAFAGIDSNWYYPRGFVAGDGTVTVIGHDGLLFRMSADGLGSIAQQATRIGRGSYTLPSLTYTPGKVLSLRKQRQAVLVDISGPTATSQRTGDAPSARFHSSMTVLPTREVLLTGGTAEGNLLERAHYSVHLWSPSTGAWRTGAAAQKARLYHSNALLMPDATVLVLGGGAPGPVTNLNAEIYHPPYLFSSDGSGELAPRPTIAGAPESIGTTATFDMTVGAGERIGRVVAVRTGSATHSFNPDQRHLELAFTQADERLTVTMPTDRRVAIPGYYLLFVLDPQGVPSIARIVRVPLAA